MIEQLKPKSFRLFKTLNGVNMKNIHIPHPKPRYKIKSEKNNNQNNNNRNGRTWTDSWGITSIKTKREQNWHLTTDILRTCNWCWQSKGQNTWDYGHQIGKDYLRVRWRWSHVASDWFKMAHWSTLGQIERRMFSSAEQIKTDLNKERK